MTGQHASSVNVNDTWHALTILFFHELTVDELKDHEYYCDDCVY